MKHHRITWLAMLLFAFILVGCGTAEPTLPSTEVPASTATPTEPSTEVPTEAPTEENTETTFPTQTEEDIVYEGDASSHYIDVVYAEQIRRYHTALSEQWDEAKYFDNGLSALPYYYGEGDPLSNVGFGFRDLDNDGHWELIIGAILNAERDPVVFEIWTLVEGEPVMVAQSDSINRYYLQYAEEDNAWYVANQGSNGAAISATYYLMLNEGKFEVMQGIVFDATADEENPWFMAYDLDWDVSNDEPIDADTANAILESNRNLYTPLELFPYIYFK